jgi:hypothetical protein
LFGKSYQKPMHDEFQCQSNEIKSFHTNNHLIKLLRLLVQEQNQNEEILLQSLKQLKKSHLLLRSQGQLSDETKLDFDVSINWDINNKTRFRAKVPG